MLDATGTVKALLVNNWDAANTDGKTPVVDKVYEMKELDLSIKDRILIYTSSDESRINGIGTTNTREDHYVSIDIRSAYKPLKDTTKTTISTITGHEHLMNLVAEVKRILRLKGNNPGGNYQAILPHQPNRDLSDKFKNLYRYLIETRLILTNYEDE